MAIRVTCSGCQRSFQTADKWAGRSTVCPACRAALVIPVPHQQPQSVDDAWGPPIQATIPQALFVHHHKTSGDAFQSGFKASLGCIVAIGISAAVVFGGCVALSVLLRPQIQRANEQQRQQAQEQFDAQFRHNMELIHDEQEKEYERLQRQINRSLR